MLQPERTDNTPGKSDDLQNDCKSCGHGCLGDLIVFMALNES